MIMPPISKLASLLAVSAALMLNGNQAFAKSGGGQQAVHPSGVSSSPSPTTPSSGPRTGACKGHSCDYKNQGNTQPPCKGGHAGPNGVMIQCQ
jgi:hypothetical protein